MSVIREFSCFDLFKFNKVNLDPLTETYGLTFYMTYQAKWPEYFYTAESPNGEIQGYIMGKAEVRFGGASFQMVENQRNVYRFSYLTDVIF